MEFQSQICQNCGQSNGPLKKYCDRCSACLEGYTTNNMTGEWGFRHADGSFSPQTRSEFDDISTRKADTYVRTYHSHQTGSAQAILKSAYLRGFNDCLQLSKEN